LPTKKLLTTVILSASLSLSCSKLSAPEKKESSEANAVKPVADNGAALSATPITNLEAMPFVPNNVNAVGILNWKALLNDPQTAAMLPSLRTQFAANPQFAPAMQVAADCGFDIFTDIDTVSVAGDTNQDKSVLISVRGKLDKTKVLACIKEKDPQGNFTAEAIGDVLLLSPDPAVLQQAKENKGKLSEELALLFGNLNQNSLLYGAALVTSTMKTDLGPAASAKALGGHFLMNNDGLSLKAIARFGSDADAASFKVVVDGTVTTFKPMIEQMKLPASALNISNAASDTIAEITLTYPQLIGVAGAAMTNYASMVEPPK
jgi:hypothetical protein